VHKIGVAAQAIILKKSPIGFFDHDRLVKILKGESFGVIIAVLGFGDVFGDEILRQMAIHTGCHCVMTGFLPRVILWFHDVAVCARGRVGAEVGQTFGVVERKKTHSSHGTYNHGNEDPPPR
jgi:hypothetical protein